MKKIITLVALVLFCQAALFAQNEKTVTETNVPPRYVKDFQNQQKDAQNVVWTVSADSSAYMATFLNTDGDKMAIRFTQKATETRYYVDSKYYPHAIVDSMISQYPSHKVDCIYIRNMKGKSTYIARIYRPSGFLFWKKQKEVKLMSFETNCKMIEVVDE